MFCPYLLLFGFLVFASVNEDTDPVQEPAPQVEPEVHIKPEDRVKIVEKFNKFQKSKRKKILEKIRKRIEGSDDPSLKEFLALSARIKEELNPERQPKSEYYDPEIYARGLVTRKYVKTKKKKDREKLEAMKRVFRVEECAPPFFARYIYDFAKNAVFDSNEKPTQLQELEDYLNGFPPDKDLVAAWLMQKWDFDSSRDQTADYFNHVYCDLDARAYPGIRIYHAMASQITMDMPDVDVIAYARLIDNDYSYISPIPPTERRTKLYQRIKEGFLDYFQYHTWIESAAWIFVNPDAAIRPELEPLRDRLIYNFALEDGNVNKITSRLKAFGNRESFIDKTDDVVVDTKERKNKSLRAAFRESRSAHIEAVRLITRDVLGEHNLLPKEDNKK